MVCVTNQMLFVWNAFCSLYMRGMSTTELLGRPWLQVSKGWRSQKVTPWSYAQSLTPQALIVKCNMYFSLIYVFLMASSCSFTLSNHITFQTRCNAIHFFFFLSLTKLTMKKRYGKCSIEQHGKCSIEQLIHLYLLLSFFLNFCKITFGFPYNWTACSLDPFTQGVFCLFALPFIMITFFISTVPCAISFSVPFALYLFGLGYFF